MQSAALAETTVLVPEAFPEMIAGVEAYLQQIPAKASEVSELHQANLEVQEVYGQSMRVVREAGRVALLGGEVLEKPEVMRLRDEFDTAFGEMLKTAKGVGEFVTIVREDSFVVKDGEVLTAEGDSLGEIIARGVESARQTAQGKGLESRWQLERDISDQQLFEEVLTPMVEGTEFNTAIAFSAYPEDAVAKYGKPSASKLGYNTEFECAMGQLYHVEEGVLKQKLVSIDSSNVAILARKLRDRNVDIPEDVKPADLITYPITGNMTYDEAAELLDEFVIEYETEMGLPPKITTTQQILEEQSGLRDRTFNALYLPNAISLDRGRKTPEINEFARIIQPAIKSMDNEHARAVTKVVEEDEFTDEHARIMHGAILYSVANAVRSAIVEKTKKQPVKAVPARELITSVYIPYQQNIIQQLGGNFIGGVQQGIVLGGCGAEIGYGVPRNPQDILSGKNNEKLDDDAGDGLGPIRFKCINGHWNTRPFGGYCLWCPKCKESGDDIGKSVGC